MPGYCANRATAVNFIAEALASGGAVRFEYISRTGVEISTDLAASAPADLGAAEFVSKYTKAVRHLLHVIVLSARLQNTHLRDPFLLRHDSLGQNTYGLF